MDSKTPVASWQNHPNGELKSLSVVGGPFQGRVRIQVFGERQVREVPREEIIQKGGGP